MSSILNFFRSNPNDIVDPLVLTDSQRWVRAITWTLVGTGLFGLAWLYLAKTEEIITVVGKLEPVGQVSKVQAPLEGVVERVNIKEGDQVRKGQILLVLDTQLSRQREAGLNHNIESIQSQIMLKQQETTRLKQQYIADQRMLQSSLQLESEILSSLKSLANQGATARLQVLQQQSKVEQVKGQLEKSRIELSRQTIVLLQDLQSLRQQLSTIQSDRISQSVSIRYQQVRSPVDGIVFDLQARSPGFVVNPREPLLTVVPQRALEASVQIPSSEIGFVKVGQLAEINIDSYPATDFGVINGKIKSIGSDSLPPASDSSKPTLLYPAKIALSSQTLNPKNETRNLPLQAGMSLNANIKLRHVSYLTLLLGGFESKIKSIQRS